MAKAIANKGVGIIEACQFCQCCQHGKMAQANDEDEG
jgi:hypothetical protein